MSDILITSTGRKFFRVDPTLVTILHEMFPAAIQPLASAARPVERTAVPMATTPKWGIFTAPLSGAVSIQCDFMRGTSYYDGPPENAHNFTVGNFTPPEDVIAAYAAAKQTAANIGGNSEAVWRANADKELLQRGPWKDETAK